MIIKTSKGKYHVIVSHSVATLRNSQGESHKTITALNKDTGNFHFLDTYENPVTEQEFQEFLENRGL